MEPYCKVLHMLLFTPKTSLFISFYCINAFSNALHTVKNFLVFLQMCKMSNFGEKADCACTTSRSRLEKALVSVNNETFILYLKQSRSREFSLLFL